MTAPTPTARRTFITFVLGALAFTAGLTAQSKPAITRADYGQWETLAVGGGGRGGGGGAFSPDGQWLAYGINRTSRSNELRVTKIADDIDEDVRLRRAGRRSRPTRSGLAYSIGYSEAEQERLRAANRPVQNTLGILNLATGDNDDRRRHRVVLVQRRRQVPRDAALSPGACRRAAAARRRAAPAAERRARRRRRSRRRRDRRPAVGATLIVRDLASGRDTTFGNVVGVRLAGRRSHAPARDDDQRRGQSRQRRAALRSGDDRAARARLVARRPYTGLTLAARTRRISPCCARRPTTRHDGPTHVDPRVDGRRLGRDSCARSTRRQTRPSPPACAPCRSAGCRGRTTARRSSRHREVGRQAAAPRARPRRRRPRRGHRPDGAAPRRPRRRRARGVDIWHWMDPVVMARAEAERDAGSPPQSPRRLASRHRQARARSASRYTETVTPIRHTNTALVAEWSAYAMDRSIGRPAADLYVADLATGARTKLKDNVNDRFAQVEPGRQVPALPAGRSVLHDQPGDDARRPTSRRASRRRSSTRNRTRPSSRSRRSASPAGRKTTRRCCCTTSSTSGRCRPTARKARSG